MSASHARVGDLVELVRRPVEVVPGQEYREIGVRSFGRGIFHKSPVSGVDIGAKRVFEIASGDLVVSNVFAWEGAVAVASERDAGRIGSHRFMTWVPDSRRVEVRYLLHYFLSDVGVAQLRRVSPGSAGRNKTLSIKAFESLIVPIPDLSIQQKIVRRIARIERAASHAAIGDVTPAARFLDRLEAGVIGQHMRTSSVALSELAEINPSVGQSLPEMVHFVPMADVDDKRGEIAGKQLAGRRELGGGYKRFLAGDLIFARISPCMQNGKVAIFQGDVAPVGYGSTEFHVLRPLLPTVTGALHTLLRTRWFRDLASERFTGTAGQQRVPAAFLKSVLVPDMTSDEGANLAARLKELDAQRRMLIRLGKEKAQLISALPQAARNEVFSTLA